MSWNSISLRTGPASDDDVRVRRDGDEWILERGDFHARWDPRTGRGRVRQNANPYSLDSVLRIVHSLILAERGGFLLHSASAICEGRAYLFSGVSGAGKTTMTRLAPRGCHPAYRRNFLLAPERAAATRHSALLSPESWPRPARIARAPVAALFFLEQGPENRVDELPSAEAVRRLMRNILFFAEDKAWWKSFWPRPAILSTGFPFAA